jgi:PPM family protein phosphatase
MVALRWGALTDVGRSRSLNEDAIVATFPVFAVADGMGGHAAGEVASQLTAEHLANLSADGEPTGERLVAAIRSANRAIFNRSLAEPLLRGMGTTVCALTIIGDRIAIANVGDSRVYTVRGGVFTQVSQDHSYVAELVNAGEITWMQARSHPHRNIVTRALGIEPDVAVDLWEFPAIVGERFLLCSDGLVDEVLDTDIAELMLANVDPQAAAAALVKLANDNGGHDNISVVVVDVIEGENNLAPAGAELPAPMVIAPYDRPTVREEDDEPIAAFVDETPRATKPGKAPKTTKPEKIKAPRSTANRIRAVVFALVLFGIIGTVIGGVQYYGTAGTHVGFSGDQVAVFKGRNGGVLWVKPSIVRKTVLTKAKLSADAQKQVAATVSFTDEKAADAWIDALSKNPALAPGMVPPTTTTVAPTTTTTLPPTTTTIMPTTTTVAGP